MAGNGGTKADAREEADRRAQKARLIGFRNHLIGYFIGMAVLVSINLLTDPQTPWFVWPLVGWGPVLALHAAYAMGLFDWLRRQ